MSPLAKIFAGCLALGAFFVGAVFLLLVALWRAAVLATSPLRRLIKTLSRTGQRN